MIWPAWEKKKSIEEKLFKAGRGITQKCPAVTALRSDYDCHSKWYVFFVDFR